MGVVVGVRENVCTEWGKIRRVAPGRSLFKSLVLVKIGRAHV